MAFRMLKKFKNRINFTELNFAEAEFEKSSIQVNIQLAEQVTFKLKGKQH